MARPVTRAAARSSLLLLLLVAVYGERVSCQWSIDAFGAVAGVATPSAAAANGRALAAALGAANSSGSATTDSPVARSVLVPQGKRYHLLPSTYAISGLRNVTLLIEGTLEAYTTNFTTYWPGFGHAPWPMLSFDRCDGLAIASRCGCGIVNGSGNFWWWYTIIIGDSRPDLLQVRQSSNFHLENITFLDSPRYHVNLIDMLHATVERVRVLVNVESQLAVMDALSTVRRDPRAARILHRLWRTPAAMRDPHELMAAMRTISTRRGHSATGLLRAIARGTVRWTDDGSVDAPDPRFPMIYALNTDGIDVSGVDIVVRDCTITNFDDAVCAKPISSSVFGARCTHHMRVYNTTIVYGVGISMGSVPPDVGGNCIDGVHVRGATFSKPLKAVYVKPNPAKADPRATGTIANIVYEDLRIDDPLWWPIWIGTQQQHQPHERTGTGCSFFYPLFGAQCPTDPQVTLANITLRRVTVNGGVFSPGVLIANASNPATGFVWDEVVFTRPSAWPIAEGYLCEHVTGVAIHSRPVPPCLRTVNV